MNIEKILLIGPQGSGKGTVGKKLSEYLHIPIISVGEMLRNLPEDHPRKKEVDDQLESGVLVSENVVVELLKEETSKESFKNGFIFDGWGRSMDNLRAYNPGFSKVIYLSIPEDESVRRLVSRRTCEKCGAVFNVISVPPIVPGVCDFCGGKLVQRDDDTEGAIKKRLEIFKSETQEAIKYFKEKGLLVEIDATGTPDEVFELVKKALE